MVYYIRFLKPPQANYDAKSRMASVKCVVTIVNDLGDDFYAGDLELAVFLRNSTGLNTRIEGWKWQPGMRALKIEFSCPVTPQDRVLRQVFINTSANNERHMFRLHKIPKILGVSSDFFDVFRPSEVSDKVQRHFDLGDGHKMVIWEETGESIARHLW